MSVYPVIWKARGRSPVAGGLECGSSSLTLHGGARAYEHWVEIEYDQLVGVGRSTERVGRLPALQLSVLGVGTVLIAALGAGLNGEILEQLEAVLPRLVSAGASV